MKIEYIKNLNGSFMIVKEADYLYENYELMMLLNNKIPGLLSLQIMIGDGKIEYWYDITGMTALDTMLGMLTLDAVRMQRLTEDIFDMNLELEHYLLDAENICYLPEMLYFDRTLERYRFCYLPGSRADASCHLQSLTEYLLTKIDHKDLRAVKMGYGLYEKSTQEGCCARELLDCIPYEEAEVTADCEMAEESDPPTRRLRMEGDLVTRQKQPIFRQKRQLRKSVFFG